MKNKLVIISLSLMLIGGGYVLAADQASSAVEVGNKFCPVSGETIPSSGEKGSMGEAVKYEYNGKVYNLCCPMCIKDFKKDPEKYSKKAEEEVAKNK